MTYKGSLHLPGTATGRTQLRDARNQSLLGASSATTTPNNSRRPRIVLVRPLFRRSQTLYPPSRDRLFLLHTVTRFRLLHHLIQGGTAARPKLRGGPIHLRDLETGRIHLTRERTFKIKATDLQFLRDRKLLIPHVFRNLARALTVCFANDPSILQVWVQGPPWALAGT